MPNPPITQKARLDLVIILTLVAIPIITWLKIMSLSQRFGTIVLDLTSLGQLAGLIGMVLFATNLVIASRHKYLEKIFFGLNRAYITHHLLGTSAFILLLWHPLFLVLRYVPISVMFAAQYLLTSLSDITILFGTIALALMIFLLILTFYIKLKYQVWKFSHKFLALAFVIASLHVYFISSDVARSPSLRAYMLFIIAMGLAAIIYRTLLDRGKVWQYSVKDIKSFNNFFYQISLEPTGKAMQYQAGQFIFVSFLGEGVSKESHPFSIASSPQDKVIKIVAKNLGDYTARLNRLKSGDKAKIRGPFGKFNYQNFPENQIWIAGGIGITPFLGMAAEVAKQTSYKAHLIYSVKDDSEGIYSGDLRQLINNNFNFTLYNASKSGFLTEQKISEIVSGITSKDILICGPGAMMKGLRLQLKDMGVSKNNIHTEEFSL